MSWKKGVKLCVCWLVRALGLCWLARKLTGRGVLIIAWHGVSLRDEHERFRSLFIAPETFQRRLEFLARHYSIVSLDEAAAQLSAGSIRPGQVVLTFDDGFYNFLVAAAPILRRFGVPATAFVVSSHMVSQQPIPNLVIRDAILSTVREEITLEICGLEGTYSLRDIENRERFKKLVLRHLRGLNREGDARLSFASLICEHLDVDYDDLCRRRVWHSLSPAEVRSLSDGGFSIQLHTHTHSNLVDLLDEPRRLLEEVTTCRRLLEETTRREAAHLCYPSGRWTKDVLAVLSGLGLKTGVIGGSAPNFKQTPMLALRRFFDGEYQTQLEFEVEISGFMFLLRSLFRPSAWRRPSESTKAYKETGKVY